MSPLDPDYGNRILVTGADGFIGTHIVHQLLKGSQKQKIHATVPSPEKSTRLQHLYGNDPRLTVHVVPDPTAPDAFVQPAGFCHAIIHVASPPPPPLPSLSSSSSEKPDYEAEILIPAVQVTQAICHAATANETVSRLVYSSSFAAVFDPSPAGTAPSKVYADDDWNPMTYEQARGAPAAIWAQQASRAFAERETWELSREQDRWDLVSLCPGVVFGAPVEGSIADARELAAANGVLWALFDQKEVPETTLPVWTSVISLAEAHVSALTTADVGGERFLVVNGSYENQELCDLIRSSIVDEATKKRIPVGKAGHRDEDLWKADGSKAERLLHFSRPTLQQTIIPVQDYLLRLSGQSS